MSDYRYTCGHEAVVVEPGLAPPVCLSCCKGKIIYPAPNEMRMWAVFSCGHHVNSDDRHVSQPDCVIKDCPGKLEGFTYWRPTSMTFPILGGGTSTVTGLESGRKFDGEKPAMDLMPPHMELEVAKVLTFGAQKYDAENWRHVPDLHARYRSAAKRHINALRRGEKYDEESGLHHAAHAVCCLMFMGEIDLEQDQAPSESLEERKINELLKRIDEIGADRASRAHRGQ